tara:strand:- start:34033 stop:34488 length:456 start_codon:yes stop_codon:yes gene_type:complete
MRSDVLNSSSNSYGAVPNYLKTTTKTADFTAVAGHVYVITKLDGCDVTLPAPKVGDVIKIIFDGATSNSHTVTTDASTTLYEGWASLSDTADQTAAAMENFVADETDDRVLTLNRTTTGLSGKVTLVGVANNRWYIEAELQSNGDASTPFS